ncbi:MAG: efflux RND transporter periplasmic adaptor subunit, partial [Candidatus Omnitrophica bacterium]|nr:efflux RND transporter periplasmic adaptor subunit [Candidatus Omnitrophota bacterium]
GVKTALVQRRSVTKTIRTVGRIAYDPVLYQAQEEYLQSLLASKKAEGSEPEIKEQAAKLVDSAKIKLRLLGLSDELILEVEKSGKPDRSLLYSEAGGRVWLYAPIYEYEIPLVKVGDQVEVEIPSMPGETFQGTVRSIDPVLDPMTRSVRIRAILGNPEGLLKPEMYGNASIKKELGEKLVIPEEAIFATGERNIVFVLLAANEFEPREVILGVGADNFYEVKSGLREGETVVTSGNFLIDSESRLKAALEGIETSGGHRHGG